MQVMTKASKRFGTVYPATPTDYFVYFGKPCKGGFESITIHKTQRDGSIKECRTFVIGDACEEDSYNLSYHGTILKITEKSITISKRIQFRKNRMTLNEFCWRNYDFDEVTSSAANSDMMMYL